MVKKQPTIPTIIKKIERDICNTHKLCSYTKSKTTPYTQNQGGLCPIFPP
jgi:hypothetical protein